MGARTLGLLGLVISLLTSSAALALEVPGPPPPIVSKTNSGAAFDLSKHQGKVVLIDFWASWCGPCKEEMPVLQTLHKEFKDKGLVVVGVSVDKNIDKMRAFLKNNPVTFPVIHDVGFALAKKYGPTKMPSSFFVDRKGVLRIVHRGFKSADVATIRGHVLKLLSE